MTAGVITAITLTKAGSGYTAPPAVTFEGPVDTRTITNGGAGCNGTINIAAPTGPGPITATATATVVAGAITKVTLTNAGAGYTSNPAVTFNGGCTAAVTAVAAAGGGSGAVIATTLVPSSIQSLTVTKAGSGYFAAPTVTISGGGGSGATATAFLSNTALVLNQQNDPETIKAVACSGSATQSMEAVQKLDFQIAQSDVSTFPLKVVGNLDANGTVGVGTQIMVSTPSDFTGQFIEVNTGGMPTNCSGANVGQHVVLNLLNGSGAIPCGGANQPACNSALMAVGGLGAASPANPIPLSSIPVVGTPLLLNTIACPETGAPTQIDPTVRTSMLTITAATPAISSTAGGSVLSTATAGPVSLTYQNNVLVTFTSATAAIEPVNICYRTDGVNPTCGMGGTPGICDCPPTPTPSPDGRQRDARRLGVRWHDQQRSGGRFAPALETALRSPPRGSWWPTTR